MAGIENANEYDDTVFEQAVKIATPALTTQPQYTPTQLSFSDKMLYKIGITIPGDVWLTINFSKMFGLFRQELIAELTTNGTLSFTRKQAGDEYTVDGTIKLTEKSTYSFIKDFSPVTGTIDFTRSLTNPNLDVTAEYVGIHKTGSSDETIKITMTLDGTLEDLGLKMRLYRKINGEFVQDNRYESAVRSDVITYLLNGSFASDTQAPSNPLGANAVASTGFELASGQLTNLISSIPVLKNYIRSVGLDYAGGQTPTKIRLTGAIKNLSYSIGGSVNSAGGVSPNDVSFELPFSILGWDHFLTTGEYHIGNSSDPGTQGLIQPPIFLGKLLVRFP